MHTTIKQSHRLRHCIACLVRAIAFAFLFECVAATQAQQIIYVNAAAPIGGNGLSWGTAYRDLQQALADAAAVPVASRNCQLWVASGTYRPGPSGDRTVTFLLQTGMALFGGFAGDEASISARLFDAPPTVLSGDLASNGDDRSDDAYHVLTVASNSFGVIVEGVTLEYGTADGPGLFQADGACALVSVPSQGTRFSRCIFRKGRGAYGVGLYFGNETSTPSGSDLVIDNCSFLENEGTAGSAIYENFSTLTIRNCTFAFNSADHPSNQTRTTIYANRGSITASNCIVSSNMHFTTFYTGAFSGSQSVQYSALQEAFAGTGNIVANPVFVSPQQRDVRLAVGSPCIDAGSPGAISEQLDLDGNTRTFDGNIDSVVRVDMGAYEFGAQYSGRLYVRASATGLNDGSSWINAYSGPDGLRSALALTQTVPGIAGEIWVAAGTYKPAGLGGSRSASFNLQNNLSIYGGFVGTETSLSQRNIPANSTVLSGDLVGDDTGDLNRVDNTFHVVTAQGVNSTAKLDGFTVRGGSASGPLGLDQQVGAGLYVSSASPLVRNCLFVDNRALSSGFGAGGALCTRGNSAPQFIGCTFQTNTADSAGAAYLTQGACTFEDCLFDRNSATGVNSGGAIGAEHDVVLTLTRSDFIQNRNTGTTGAIEGTQNVAIRATNCRFLGNFGFGSTGGIRIGPGSSVAAANCLFAGNSTGASPGAGGVYAGGGGTSALFTNCSIISNTSSAGFGAIQTAGSVDGLSLVNCVAFSNSADGQTSQGSAIFTNGGPVTIQYSSIQGWTGSYGGTANNGADPRVLRAASIGPDGQWGTPDDDYGDLHLAINSPAIDSGNVSAVPQDAFDVDSDGNLTESLPIDLDGAARFYDYSLVTNTGNGSPPVDRGCYEFAPPDTTVPGDRRWVNAAGGTFEGFGNWYPGVPGVLDSGLCEIPGAYTITLNSAPQMQRLTVSRGDPTINLNGRALRLNSSVLTGLTVGDGPDSVASLSLSNSSTTLATVTSSSARIGSQADSVGTLNLSGASTRLTVPSNDTCIGCSGTGTMNITGGAAFVAQGARVGADPGSSGLVTVSGPNSRFNPTFYLIINNGEVNVSAGAELNCFVTFLLNAGRLTGDGTINSTVYNFGQIAPGNSPGMLTINGDYLQVGEIADLGPSSGKLTMQVAGTNPGQFDRLVVTGQTQLGGGLIIQGATPTSALPIPPEGLSLPLIDALGGIGTDSATGQLRNRFDVAFFPRVPGANNGPSDKFLRLAQAEGGGARFFNLVDGTLGAPINVNDPTNTGAAGTPSAVAAGDLDGDGLDDLAITTASSNIVTVLMNRGTIAGEWQGFEGAVQFNTGSNPQGLAIGDIDGDGMKDLAIANQGANSVSLLKNATVPGSHAAAFTGQGSLATGTGPVGIVVENFDGGGTRPVIVTADELGGGLSIFIRSSGPGFGFPPRVPKQLPVNFPPAQPACIDIDGDMQRPDLAVRSRSGNAVLILQNLSSGTGNVNFADAIVLPVGNSPESMQVAKLANGKSSLVTANSGSNTISVLVNTAGPGNPLRFAPAVDLPAGTMPLSIASLDVDGDTDGDLAVLTNTGGGTNPIRVRLLRNDFIVGAAQGNDQPTFVIDRDLPDEGAPTDALFVISANLVSQNTTDLLTINRQGGGRGPGGGNLMGNIRPRLNTTQGGVNTCPQDFNGDGEVNPDDLADFIGCFFSQPPCPTSDYNQSGETDPDDLADFIGAYFGLGC